MPLEIRGAHFLIRSAQLVRGTRLEYASAVNVTLLAFVAAAPCCGATAGRRPAPLLSIDIPPLSRKHGAQQQTYRTPRLRSHDGTDGQTDRRTDGRTIVS